jgi:hypothetical protein
VCGNHPNPHYEPIRAISGDYTRHEPSYAAAARLVTGFRLAVKAGAIVTGDKDLLTLGQYQAVRILTARVFLTELVPDA